MFVCACVQFLCVCVCVCIRIYDHHTFVCVCVCLLLHTCMREIVCADACVSALVEYLPYSILERENIAHRSCVQLSNACSCIKTNLPRTKVEICRQVLHNSHRRHGWEKAMHAVFKGDHKNSKFVYK